MEPSMYTACNNVCYYVWGLGRGREVYQKQLFQAFDQEGQTPDAKIQGGSNPILKVGKVNCFGGGGGSTKPCIVKHYRAKASAP